MKMWIKVLLITILFGIPAFVIGPILWTPSPDIKPTPVQLPFFIFLSVVEAAIFGLGIAFIIFGWPLVKKVSKSNNLSIAAFVSLSWLMVSWWPHDNSHIHNGMNAQGLLYIDYTFHVTIIIASLVLAYYFVNALNVASITKAVQSKK